MIREKITIHNKNGLHARPASLLVKCTAKFSSDIFLKNDCEKINAKSIMGVILLAAEQGRELLLEISGPDEQDALEAIQALLNDKKFCEA